jgi:hypothetical protein
MKKLDDALQSEQNSPAGEKEIFSSQDPQVRLARIISDVTNPLFIALPVSLAIALHTAPDVPHALLWWIIIVAGMYVIPYLFILRGVRRGNYSDYYVSDRKQRLIPLSFGLGCTIITLVLLLFLHTSRAIIATTTAGIVAQIVSIVITQRWKISLHAAYIAGAVTTLVFVFGPICLPLALLIVVVAWARWQVHAHRPPQTLAGAVLAVIVTVATFWLFGIH